MVDLSLTNESGKGKIIAESTKWRFLTAVWGRAKTIRRWSPLGAQWKYSPIWFPVRKSSYYAPHSWRQSSDSMKIRKTWAPLNDGVWRKEEMHMTPREANMLREKYPNHVPREVASQYLGVSPRQLSKLIAEGREPFASIGANIGTNQKYIRIYTERLIAYMNGQLSGV